MADRSFEPGIFDSDLFPQISEIEEDPTSYVSPLTAINQEIRRKNVAAAAATSGPHESTMRDSIDPWESLSLVGSDDPAFTLDDYITCACKWTRRRGSWAAKSSPLRIPAAQSRSDNQDRSLSESMPPLNYNMICPTCGKQLPVESSSSFAWEGDQPGRYRTTSFGNSQFHTKEEIEEPNHAQALLQTTPQLRILSPSSTDMQGAGQPGTRNFFGFVFSSQPAQASSLTATGPDSSKKEANSSWMEYRASLMRERTNQLAAAELSNLLWVLAHEMSLEDYGMVESEVFTAVFALVHAVDKDRRMAGLAAVDSLLAAPSSDDEKKAIKFANTLSNGLRAAHGDFEFLSAVSRALGHMATRIANVDFVESEVTRALEWISTDRSDRRLAACLALKEFAIHAPTTFHSKTSHSTLGQGGSNEFLNEIFQAIRDPQPIVRACAADALSQCLKILVQRQHVSLTGLLCQVFFSTMEGLQPLSSKKRSWQVVSAAEAARHGSLLVVATMLAYTRDFMLPRFEETCVAVLKFTTDSKALIRLEVVRLIPRLARRCPHIFGRRYLEQSLNFLMESASTPTPARVGVDVRSSAYTALGNLILAMMDETTGQVIGGSNLPTIKISDDPQSEGGHIVELYRSGVIFDRLAEIFALARSGVRFRGLPSSSAKSTLSPALHCAASLVEALGDLALPYIADLIDDMFLAGLSNDLIQCLKSISQCVPAQRSVIEDRMLQEVSICLGGGRGVNDPLVCFRAAILHSTGLSDHRITHHGRSFENADAATESPRVDINMSEDPETIRSLVLSLQTLASFGGSMGKVTFVGTVVPLLPFVQNVAARYLLHPSSEVRRAAALTCCVLLVPHGFAQKSRVGSYSGVVIEDVLQMLLRVAVSDPSGIVRLCVVRALDSRYDSFLCQRHHLQQIVLLLQDELLATRAAGLRLLGRLAGMNPGPIVPVLRTFLNDLIVELQCGVDTGRGREEATRLLVVFLRAKPLQRLIHPVLPSLIDALPLEIAAPPRLASASLEALGELARATGVALQPWINHVVPHVLEIMHDQSSASKQRTSLRTLGQIAGTTGYIIKPYLEHPRLLTQATDILPATKRAPWSLRREVIRTLGILGALDPDRYLAVASKTRKGGAVGGAYLEEFDPGEYLDTSGVTNGRTALVAPITTAPSSTPGSESKVKRSTSDPNRDTLDADDDNMPAYLYMYEQYAMIAQPVSSLAPSRRMVPSDEGFYPTVAIQALMRIFRDQGLVAHHGICIQAVMYIFKSMGLKCVTFLPKVVPYMIYAVRTCEASNLRELLLKQVAMLSLIVREHLRPYVADIFEVVERFWSSRHLATLISVISHIAVGVPDEFRRFMPKLIRRLLMTFDELHVTDWAADDVQSPVLSKSRAGSDKIRLLLKSITNLKGVLREYRHILVPALLKLADSIATLSISADARVPESILVELSVLVFTTISALLQSQSSTINDLSLFYFREERFLSKESSENGLPSRVVQPMVRLFREKSPRSPAVGLAMIRTFCVCATQIGGSKWMRLYDTVVRQAINTWQAGFPIPTTNEFSPSSIRIDDRPLTSCRLYDEVIRELLNPDSRRSPLAIIGGDLSGLSDFGLNDQSAPNYENISDAYEATLTTSLSTMSARARVNQSNLQRAWDVSQRASRDDWDEWMRRFAIQLLREAPSPALRSTANLAHAYQPLARELFSAAFACCWNELTEPYRINLVHALETAFVADVSPEILQALLNLAEFMEHVPNGGLPIEIHILADLALKCRAYAKALHCKEREYVMGVTGSCIESLISINRKLDLPEAALGILKASSIAEAMASDDPIVEESSTIFSRHQSYDMCYSVIWNTEEIPTKSGALDLASKEELWLAKLGSWTQALAVYEDKLKRNPEDFDAMLGCMRSLAANGEWRKVLALADDNWASLSGYRSEDVNARSKRKAVRICAQASWRLGRWDQLEKFATQLVGAGAQAKTTTPNGIGSVQHESKIQRIDFEGAFYSAVLHIHRREWANAADAIDAARRAMDGRMTALMAESYSRAYPSMVTAMTLAEMEEIIEYRQLEEVARTGADRHPVNRPNVDETRERLLSVWRDRLAGCRADAEVHALILAVRSLVLGPGDEVEATLKLSELSRQAQRYKFAERVLLDPLEALDADLNGPTFGFGLTESLGTRVDFSNISRSSSVPIIEKIVNGDLRSILPTYGPRHEQWSRNLVSEAGGLEQLNIQYRLYFAYVKHLWFTDRRDEAMTRLHYLCDVVDMVSHFENAIDTPLRVSCWLELGEWKLTQAASPDSFLSDGLQAEVLTSFRRATSLEGSGYKAWHDWALLNFRIALQTGDRDSSFDEQGQSTKSRVLRNHILAAVEGFVNAISRGTRRWTASVQQDLLNILTCLFKFGGSVPDVASAMNERIGHVPIEAWLGVLPQLLARIHMKDPAIRSVLHPLLIRIGEKHPQALMYPLSVLLKSPVAERKNSAESLMNSLKAHSSDLVEEAQMVSSELIRVAILWLETWHEGLEDASRLYFGEGNVAAMLDLLLPLHDVLEKGAETRREAEFLKSFGQDLAQAHAHIQEYMRIVTHDGSTIPTGHGAGRQSEEAETAMNRAWDIYYTVFRRINKQLPSLTKLELSQCSPALSRAKSLELGVPGSYRVDGSYVKIEKVLPSVEVITSKQRPRKITILGSDGKDYVFLLKGHEDLRQDERVMQLFGLVNALLLRKPETKRHDLKIQRYAISPLSHNCGLVGWVPHCDTLHSLIRDYRQSKKIPLNMENREMLKIAPDYDMLTVMQKVEVFTDALKKTTGRGNDLYEILWLKSTNSEEWLERRTKFTRSQAVMCQVGYILGLGDRHPSNLMLDKVSGRILHIDFGDCFEVAMNRDKFPERVPFRLTRMLIKAMEVSGIEGSYRNTCERTMTVLRGSRDSLVTMLEAFVYDPLISWRLADLSPGDQTSSLPSRNIGVGPLESEPALTGVPNVPIESGVAMAPSIAEGMNEDDDEEDSPIKESVLPSGDQLGETPLLTGPVESIGGGTKKRGTDGITTSTAAVASSSRARSLQIYSNIQTWAANLSSDSRIASITADRTDRMAAEGSIARSRIERSMRQREFMSTLGAEEAGAAHEEALNEKALKVIRRVQDKLTGTDFPDCKEEPLDVPEQVQRLIVQATSSENLCQLFIGWCSFW